MLGKNKTKQGQRKIIFISSS